MSVVETYEFEPFEPLGIVAVAVNPPGPPSISICSSCLVPISPTQGLVTEIHLYNESNVFDRSVSITEAIREVFGLEESWVNKKLKDRHGHGRPPPPPHDDLTQIEMCSKCAEATSLLYRDYLNVQCLTRPGSILCDLVSQIQKFHDHDSAQAQDGSDPEWTETADFSDFFGDGHDSVEIELENRPKSPSKKSNSSSTKKLRAKYAAQKSENQGSKTKGTNRKNKSKSSRPPKIKIPSSNPSGNPNDPPRRKRNGGYICRNIYKKPKIQCNKCEHSEAFNWKLQHHILLEHEKKEMESCPICGFKYFSDIILGETHKCPKDETSAFQHFLDLDDADEVPGTIGTTLKTIKTKKSKWKPIPYTCPICGEGIKTLKLLEHHQEVIHVRPGVAFRCIICQRDGKSKAKLMDHMEIHDVNKKYLCSECGTSFSQTRGLARHLLTHMNKEFICSTCPPTVGPNGTSQPRTFPTQETLDRHILRNHTKPIFTTKYCCESCVEVFSTVTKFHLHRLRTHLNDSKFREDYWCRFCETDNWKKCRMKNHLLQKMNDEMKSQEAESRRLTQRRSWKSEVSVRNVKFDTPVPCKECGKKFLKARSLKYHEDNAHRADGPLQCDQCPAQLKNADTLRKHRKLHSRTEGKSSSFSARKQNKRDEDRKFGCETCGKGFFNKKNLNEHMQTVHSDPIPCPICNHSLGNKKSLIRHLRSTHPDQPEAAAPFLHKSDPLATRRKIKVMKGTGTGEEKEYVEIVEYKCPKCSKIFGRKKNLNEHIRYVHSEGPDIQCELCEVTVRNEIMLKRHMRRKHAVKPETTRSSAAKRKNSRSRSRSSLKIKEEAFSSDYSNLDSDNDAILPSKSPKRTSTRTIKKPMKYEDEAEEEYLPTPGKSTVKRGRITPSPSSSGGKNFSCDICHKRLPNEGSLQSHLATSHPQILKALSLKTNKAIGTGSSSRAPVTKELVVRLEKINVDHDDHENESLVSVSPGPSPFPLKVEVLDFESEGEGVGAGEDEMNEHEHEDLLLLPTPTPTAAPRKSLRNRQV